MLLSKQSAKIGSFKVIVCDPWKDHYMYQWQGKNKEVTVWRCMLISCDDPTVYCNGDNKLKVAKKVEFAKTHESVCARYHDSPKRCCASR